MASRAFPSFITVAVTPEFDTRLRDVLRRRGESRSEFIRSALERAMAEDGMDEKRFNNSLLFLHVAMDNLLQSAGPGVHDKVHAAHRELTGKPVAGLILTEARS